MQEIEQILSFMVEIEKLKDVQRKTKPVGLARYENSAEHSWHVCLSALMLHKYANEPVDINRVIKMLLIHDIVEIDAGDTFFFDTTKNHTNTDEELVAAKRIFGLLPEEQSTDLIAIWEEFEACQSAEAKFAKAMDRFNPMLQNSTN